MILHPHEPKPRPAARRLPGVPRNRNVPAVFIIVGTIGAAWLLGFGASAPGAQTASAAELSAFGTQAPALTRGAGAAAQLGRPVCVRVGTRSEGWAWPGGRFIRWAKCKGVTPKCLRPTDDREEGWYANQKLIVKARCSEGGGISSEGDSHVSR
jgi:hypothetical protein